MIVAHQSSAQLVKKVIADKIVAQVGDKIILRSDVLNAISDAKRQGTESQLPPNPECAFLEGQLIQKALVLQAEKDSLTVTDDELDAALENQVRGFIREYGSKEVLEEIAGKTVYQIKEDFKPVFRERKLADQMRNKVLENVKITPTEVKVYFNKIPKDSLPYYETELEVSQILLIPKSNKDVDEYVIKQLYDYRRQAEAGTKKFEQLAKLYSDDQGTEKQGGTLALNRNDKGSWDPTFLSAAFKLKEGQISPVIKSKFGYHIIQMVSRAGDDAVVRHILKIPPVTDDEIKLATQKLDSIRVKLLANELSFGEAINKYSEDENSKFNGGAIQSRDGSTYITIDQLDKDMVVAIKDLKPGEYSKPQYYIDERGRKLVRLILLKTRTSPHRENLKDDYNKIAQRALEDKKQDRLEKWFKEHLPSYYISIDKEFEGCTSLADWWKYAAKN
ncbi:MAG: peptidylprolyl isomerase [Bacteroidota bacterium]|nr:peptidylprolyl isomerase [Bacteroidota bacterium]